jgi:hypothetical protein
MRFDRIDDALSEGDAQRLREQLAARRGAAADARYLSPRRLGASQQKLDAARVGTSEPERLVAARLVSRRHPYNGRLQAAVLCQGLNITDEDE